MIRFGWPIGVVGITRGGVRSKRTLWQGEFQLERPLPRIQREINSSSTFGLAPNSATTGGAVGDDVIHEKALGVEDCLRDGPRERRRDRYRCVVRGKPGLDSPQGLRNEPAIHIQVKRNASRSRNVVSRCKANASPTLSPKSRFG